MEPRVIFIQIVKCVMQPKVWRFIGLASSIVGLICYALSSSFNYLFGEWKPLKIFIYSIFSFIICIVIFFANIWQHSRSRRFKAHIAFLVLTLTSLYSFFLDKVMHGKPDAYSLISCASFSIMFLSLSKRRIECGFETDLLYFFLGCLIVQLMKIKLHLFIVGAGFSYLIIILRSCFSSMDFVTLDNEDSSIQDGNSVVIELHSHSPQLASNHMEQFSNCVKALKQENPNLINLLLEQLKDYLSDDYELKLSDPNFEEVLRPKQILNLMIDALPAETIDNIHKTAKFEVEFFEVYVSCRREWLVESLSRLGFPKLSMNDLQMLSWEEIEDKIKRWMKISNVAFKILFYTERKLCDRFFFGFSSASDVLFTEVCKESTLEVLYFAEAVAIGSRSPERLFRLIDMFEAMRDLIPQFEPLFGDRCSVFLQKEASTIWNILGVAIKGIFAELDNLIREDPTNLKPVPRGGTHPLTRYVMHYLSVACDSWKTLEQVFEEDYEHPLKKCPEIEDSLCSSSSFELQIDLIIKQLEMNLEAKSKMYKDPILCYVFLMNNHMYMLHKIIDSEVKTILGDAVVKEYREKVRQHHELYQRISWNKVLELLKLESNGSMIDNLKAFNMLFEEICRVQSSWFVFGKQLREEIRISIQEILLPAYENFIEKFQNDLKHADKFIKYGIDDIKARLNDLFRGSRGSTGSTKQSFNCHKLS